MARWTWVEIRWQPGVRPPNASELRRMRQLFLCLDGDAPAALDGYPGRDSFGDSVPSHCLNETGVASVWRSPSVPVTVPMAVFHHLGFPNQGYAVEGGYAADWEAFEENVRSELGMFRHSSGRVLGSLAYLDQGTVRRIQKATRRLDPYLPGRNHAWPTYGSKAWCARGRALWEGHR